MQLVSKPPEYANTTFSFAIFEQTDFVDLSVIAAASCDKLVAAAKTQKPQKKRTYLRVIR